MSPEATKFVLMMVISMITALAIISTTYRRK